MTEDQLEQEALGWLTELGYTHRHGSDIAPDSADPQRSNYQQVLLLPRLLAAMQRLNPGLPDAALEDALQQLQDFGLPMQTAANQAFHRLLVGGVPVQYPVDGEVRGDFVRLVDWADTSNNDFWAVNQFTVKGTHHTRRFDIILFINGLPLVLVELKSPADTSADIWKAYDQIQTYKDQIPDVFQYNEILVVSDGSEARLGSLTATQERYMQWRTIEGDALDPLGDFNELQTLLRGLMAPQILLPYLRFFVLFADDGALAKKIAGYHQFHAVQSAMPHVLAAHGAALPEERGRGGVVWHTQGSGKSITMTCFAARVMQEPALHNPTIVVITDRNDLDGQLFGVFSMAHDLLREQPLQAGTRAELRSMLNNRPSGGIIFVTIQKFFPEPGEAAFPELSARSNIVVIADEAHRTQYGFEARLRTTKPKAEPKASTHATAVVVTDGAALATVGAVDFAPPDYPAATMDRYLAGYAKHLRDALPNAVFVAFTGTPVSNADRDTRAVFGDYIHVYDMQQAREDGATVAIYYESRLAKIRFKDEALAQMDDAVEELAEDEEEGARSKLKNHWAALERVVGAEPRIARVAADLVAHFEQRCAVQNGKAMVVAMSREICAHLYNEIIKLRPAWHDPDPEKGVVKIVMTGSASDKPLLRPHLYSGSVKKRLEKRFKDAADPMQIVIVRDMWLTGFDAPCVHTMYVDKPMKGHNLMQAIARVNRVFKGKEGGLVVDYIGIGNELKAAMKEYTASKGRGRPTVDTSEALAALQEKMEVARTLLHGFDYSGFRTGGHKTLAGAANHVLALPSVVTAKKAKPERDGKKRFADVALAIGKAFSLCCTLDDAKPLREEVAFFQAVKVILTKREITAQRRTDEQRDLAMRQIVNQALVSDVVVDIFDAVGLDKPDIGLLDEAFLQQVQQLPERNLAVELLKQLLEGEIRAKFATNLVQERKFSDLLSGVVSRYQNRSIETAQVMEELIEMAKKFKAAANRGEQLGLSEDEVLFYDALANNESAVRELTDETLKKIAHELTENLRKNITVDWSQRENVRASLRLMVKRVLRKYKYPPDMADAAVELVLQQAAVLGDSWEVSA